MLSCCHRKWLSVNDSLTLFMFISNLHPDSAHRLISDDDGFLMLLLLTFCFISLGFMMFCFMISMYLLLLLLLLLLFQIIGNLDSGSAPDGSPMKLSAEARKEGMRIWSLRRLRVKYAIANNLCLIKGNRYADFFSIFPLILFLSLIPHRSISLTL